MNITHSIFVLLFITISFSNCSKETIDENSLGDVITDSVFYDTDIKLLIDANCISCHSGSNQSGDINLSTYKLVKFEAEFGRLIKRINDPLDPMPTFSKGGLMSAENRGKFDKWVADGFLEKE